jgi:hypothetical protein
VSGRRQPGTVFYRHTRGDASVFRAETMRFDASESIAASKMMLRSRICARKFEFNQKRGNFWGCGLGVYPTCNLPSLPSKTNRF